MPTLSPARKVIAAARRSRIKRGDPTETAGLQRTYMADMRRRWRELGRVIQTTVVTNDALTLSGGLQPLALQMRPAGRFEFRSDPVGKGEDFLAWLRRQMDAGILEVSGDGPRRPSNSTRWQSTYVRASYQRGVDFATRQLRAAGVAIQREDVRQVFGRPIHATAVATLYTRQFTDLAGITDQIDATLSRILADGFTRGIGPREMARNMRQQVASIGMGRSLTLARTETVRAHAEATLNRYEQFGVERVQTMAEFITAGDDRVCPDCYALETGQPVRLNEARGLIPVHPNCRCAWLPVLERN